MPQYLALVKDNVFTLPEEEQHHLKVARIKAGQELKLFDGKGRKFLGVLNTPKSGLIIKQLPCIMPPRDITLYFSIISRPATEELIDLCTQAGVSAFCPVISKFSDKDLLKKWQTKLDRWQQLTLASSKQCETPKVPEILPPLSFEDAIKKIKIPALICYESENKKTICEVAKTLGKEVALFIGPEGGYDEEEITLAKTYNVIPVTLGVNILRAQTAAACAVWALQNL